MADIEQQAQEMFLQLADQPSEKEDVTEKHKAENPMQWDQRINNIRNRATEIGNAEMIYA